jgi:hypothetical protein
MSEYDDRHEALVTLVREAHEGFAGLAKEQRQAAPDDLRRLEDVLAYASVVIDQVDSELVTEGAHTTVTQRLTELRDNAVSAGANPNPYAEGLLDALRQLPADPRAVVADEVKETVARVQRSASQRLNALKRQAQQLSESITASRQELDQQVQQYRDEQQQQAAEQLAQLSQRVQEIHDAIESERQRIETTVTEQADRFRAAQDERADRFQQREQEHAERLDRLENESQERVQTLVTEIERMQEESARLVGAIGITGTAERYGNEANEQRRIADLLRVATVVAVLLAVGVAIFAALKHRDTGLVVAKLVISLVLAGLAGYLARQSGQHRTREQNARGLQLDLTAFPVFIESLPEDDQVEETVRMVRRSFLGARRGESEDDEPGPALSQFVRRRRAKEGDNGAD